MIAARKRKHQLWCFLLFCTWLLLETMKDELRILENGPLPLDQRHAWDKIHLTKVQSCNYGLLVGEEVL